MPFSFSTLNVWRQLYVVLVWMAHIGAAVGLLALTFFGGSKFLPLIIVASALLIAAAWLTHVAVCTRHSGLQTTVLVLNLVANPVGALIMLSIMRVTKIELAAAA